MAGSGAEMMSSMAYQVNMGIAQARKNLERSRGMLQSMTPIPEADLSNIWNTSLLIADSNPSAEQSWRVEPAMFQAIARVHWKQWDMKSHAKKRVDLGSLMQNSMGRLLSWQGRYMTRVYSTMGHGIFAVYHDNFTKETTDPLYFRTKGTYPSLGLITTGNETDNKNDKIYRLRLQDVLFHFHLTQNMSFTVSKRYYSTQYLAEVFTQAGLANSEADAIGVMNTIGLNWSHFKHLNRASGKGFGLATLGRDLHTIHNIDLGNGTNRQAMLVALIADFASFHGNAGWVWFNSMLIQGAWPWLGGYSKSYAKTVFTAMVCLFCCVRHGYTWNGVDRLILRLARKLVDPEAFGGGRIKFRNAGRLAGVKVLYEPVPKKSGDKNDISKKVDVIKSMGKKQPVAEVVEIDTDESLPAWTPSTPVAGADSQLLVACRHVIPGQPCNHSPEMRFTGRITLASSLSELESACNSSIAAHPGSKPTVVVTKTYGDAHGQLEAETYLRREKMLSVRKGEKQCVACAVKLAHLIGAVAVIV